MARGPERGHERLEGIRTGRARVLQVRDRGRVHVVDDAVVAASLEAPDHVGAHPAESDHAQFHGFSPLWEIRVNSTANSLGCRYGKWQRYIVVNNSRLFFQRIEQISQSAGRVVSQVYSEHATTALLERGQISERLGQDQSVECIVRLRYGQMVGRLIDDL